MSLAVYFCLNMLAIISPCLFLVFCNGQPKVFEQNISSFSFTASALHDSAECCFVYAGVPTDPIAAFAGFFDSFSDFLNYHRMKHTLYLDGRQVQNQCFVNLFHLVYSLSYFTKSLTVSLMPGQSSVILMDSSSFFDFLCHNIVTFVIRHYIWRYRGIIIICFISFNYLLSIHFLN